jgi:diguanylate cyclase (GGDEF)-like protein/PAS domain S-box-containing protein
MSAMKRDASDDGAARMFPPLKDEALGRDYGQDPGYWPAWIVSGIALIFIAVQYLWLPGTSEIDFSGLAAEALICLIPLAGLFVIQHLRSTSRIYWPLMTGLSFLLLSHGADALDEVRVQPAIVGILIEDGLAVSGYALLVWGLVRWLRFNRQLLAEIQALNADLEQRVAARTEGEIAERQQFGERLRESEGRYRELNAGLEQRVAERTAEVHAANALLREREERLEFILKGSRLGAWDWHIASGKVERNDYWAAMLGYSRQEVDDATANGWLELIHPDDRARAWQSIEDHLAGRTALHQMEYRMRTREGGYRWILDRARIVSRDGEGRPLRMSGTQEDITSRKQIQQALEESHQRLTTILNAMDAQIYLADMETHEILFMNQPLIQALGPVEGQPCYRALQGLDAPCHFCTNDKLVKADGSPAGIYQWEFQNQLNHCWYDLRDCAVRWTDGRLVRMEIATDVTERKQIELRLRQSEERFRLLATHALDNIWVMGPDYRLRYISPSIQTLTGYTVQEYLDMALEQWLMPTSVADAAAYFAALDERRAAGISVADLSFRGEIELSAKDGTGVWTEIIATPLVDAEGRMTELAGVTRDIRERKGYEAQLHQAREAAEIANRALLAANTELQRLATTDRLTGIWNRLHFDEAAVAEIERAARYGEPLSLLIFDIDHFKTINDTHGHLVGDQVLVELTQRVRQHLRTADVLARWGGEEFVVLLPHTRGEDAVKLAEKLRRLVAGAPFPEVGQVTSSFGVAEFRPHETTDLWLTRVDDALYAAKAGGRNRVCLAAPT